MLNTATTPADRLLIERAEDIVTLTLNQPDTRNAITDAAMVEALVSACETIQADDTVRCVIITGAGKGFSSGGNVKHMRDKAGLFGGAPAQLRENYRRGIQRVTRAVFGLDVPTIAAVNGPAYGAGCDLALMCDMRICAETAVFAENFVKVGIIPGDGGAWLLPRAVGRARAAEMAFTGEPIDAATALEWGLVSRVVPQDRLLEEARTLAARVAANPPQALRMTKRLMREGETGSLDGVLELSAAYQALCHHTRDHEEAVAAILEKRSPSFSGR
ncbi:Enoyl-CoA hydratase [Caenispirillum salinarum AK4]|uniref:Enoyl-CoA hydratase n=1 Tax=Caenispirillum salinarum AK4 TaxID=1238182 RepID=K9H2Q8_9PROT|nr:crotonase/enoyl-CoA hydratase family protein [Caenispirillum salinarum]EKV31872.1 Enoyl-CoA hydratase [Caenispirillum salinarum AK4]